MVQEEQGTASRATCVFIYIISLLIVIIGVTVYDTANRNSVDYQSYVSGSSQKYPCNR